MEVKKLIDVFFSCVCLVIDHEFLRNVKVGVNSSYWLNYRTPSVVKFYQCNVQI